MRRFLARSIPIGCLLHLARLFLGICCVLIGYHIWRSWHPFDPFPNSVYAQELAAYLTSPTAKVLKLWPARDVLAKDYTGQLAILLEPKVPNCDSATRLLIMVKSAVAEIEARAAVRKTWRKWAVANQVRVVFMTGLIGGHNISQAELKAEAETFNDIVQVSFADNYQNVSLKSFSMLLWQQSRCGKVPWVLNCDSDVMVLLPNVMRFLAQLEANHMEDEETPPLIYGDCWAGATPHRNKSLKWYVSETTWGGGVFPRYCGGPGYLMSGSVPQRILRKVPSLAFVENFHMIDDVLVTGVLSWAAGIKVQEHPGFVSRLVQYFNPCQRDLFTIHEWKPPSLLESGWSTFESASPKCSYWWHRFFYRLTSQ